MATRLYLPASGAPPLGSLAVNANWELTNGLVRLPCFTAKQNTPLATSQRTWPAGVTQQWAWWQFQSDILKYAYNWLATDTVSMVIGKCAETTTQGDTHLAYVIRVVSGDGATIRGVIGLYHATSSEYPLIASAATRIHSGRVDGATAFSSQVGDRIIVEIGLHGVTPALELIQMRIGDPTPPPDDFALTAGLTTDLCPWLQLSRDVQFGAPPEEHSGSSIISGKGALSGTAQKGGRGPGLISGKGALVALGVAAMFGLATLHGGGTLAASGSKFVGSSAAVISGKGALTPTGAKGASSFTSISGAGAVTATGKAGFLGVAVISGKGALSSSGLKGGQASALASGNGTLLAGGSKGGEGPAVLSGNGGQSASGTKAMSSAALISGGGSAISSGAKGALDLAVVSGGGDLAGAGTKQGFGTPSVSGNGILMATGTKQEGDARFGTAAISGGGVLFGNGGKSAFSAASISGAGSLLITGIKSAGGVSVLVGGGHIIASGGIIAAPEKTWVPAEFWASTIRRKGPKKPSEKLVGVKKFPR